MLLLSDRDDALKHLDAQGALAAEARRRELLAAIAERGQSSFGGSKPHLGPLSPGCQLCGQGYWSCLFTNPVCNADCFFCPGHAKAGDAPPIAERIAFRAPAEYVSYLKKLGFRGASFSGGEPLLSFRRVVEHVTAIRAELGSSIYVWAYTNGIAATPEKLAELARAGLDEIRFNIAATGYRLDAVHRAVGVVPRVTVEIPCVPEDAGTLRELLPSLQRAGVDHLNLHQLMVVGNNVLALMERGYTFLRDQTNPVVESELCALELMKHALDEGIALPINYCNTAFKDRWQNQVEDRRASPLVMKGHETLTAPGFLRTMWIAVSPPDAAAITARFQQQGLDAARWECDDAQGLLYLHPTLLARLEPGAHAVHLAYSKTVVGERDEAAPARSAPGPCALELLPGKTIGIRRIPCSPPIELGPAEVRELLAGKPVGALRWFEQIPEGLAPYR